MPRQREPMFCSFCGGAVEGDCQMVLIPWRSKSDTRRRKLNLTLLVCAVCEDADPVELVVQLKAHLGIGQDE